MTTGIPSIEVTLTKDVIDSQRLVDAVTSKDSGAIVLFLGNVREMTTGRQTLWLEYDGHRELAQAELERLAETAMSDFGVHHIAIIHRLGKLELAETAVAICVASGHRKEAFAACSWLMDRIKETVPIWKKENWADGSTEWVHPSAEGARS